MGSRKEVIRQRIRTQQSKFEKLKYLLAVSAAIGLGLIYAGIALR